MRRLFVVFAVPAVVAAVTLGLDARQSPTFEPALFRELHWRNIGPFRAGRTSAATGIASQPNVFLIGAAYGGIWKTTDSGRTWLPIFDDQPTGSIGAIAIAPSDPTVIYVGTGEGSQQTDFAIGDGLYKSSDAGRSWSHLGLDAGQQIPRIIVDPRDPNRLFVAVLGHPSGPNNDRGIFRSVDGGRTFQKVLYKDQDTGGVDLAFDPLNSNTVYAALWQARQGPWETAQFSGPGSGVFKSVDGGTTWRNVMTGLPTFADDALGRIAIAVAPSTPLRIFAAVNARGRAGLYRSDNGGDSWSLVNSDSRLTGRSGESVEVVVDPKNPDIVYEAGPGAWKSADGGKTFGAWRSGSNGETYHRLWINPSNRDAMVLAGDQGGVVTVNGGRTWSSEYNQPTAELSHVSTDNAFPYRVCGAQKDSGAACVPNRGSDGQITSRDWHAISNEGGGFVAPDPNDPDVLYGGRVTRYDRRTGQVQDVGPAQGPNFRALGSAPLLFSPVESRTLFFGANTLWKSLNGGQAWLEVSPDLSREQSDLPESLGVYRSGLTAAPAWRGAIMSVAPSNIDSNVIWAGTDDGTIHVTRDSARTWLDVTPAVLTAWANVQSMETSHFDSNTAYAVVNMARVDDGHPHIFRTRDGGRSWLPITRGLPDIGVVNVVREDTLRRGLLFAGADEGVFVSFDDGDSWSSLRLNLPPTSVRDLTVKDEDLVVATRGRGFWILGDITPLRQITADISHASAYLFRPPTAWRFRSNKSSQTPLPLDEPVAPNPPDGVVISYLLGPGATGPVTLEIIEASTGELLRRYASDNPDDALLAVTPGLHRFVWDVRYGSVDRRGAKMSPGMWAMPGTYQVRLTVGGRSYRQAVVVKMDPRVRTPIADVALQFKLSKGLTDGMRHITEAQADVKKRQASVPAGDAARWSAVDTALQQAYEPLADLLDIVQSADARPTTTAEAAVAEALRRVDAALADYELIR